MIKQERVRDSGYALVAVLVLLSLGLVLAAGMVELAGTNTKTRAIVNTQSDYYYEAEETLNRIVGWLQDNNKNLVTAFINGHFGTNFTPGKPSLGDNEGAYFGVPTMVKMPNGTSSVMLSNNDFFGTSAFPTTTNLDTGAAFNAVQSFNDADLGKANARLILTWARNSDGNYEPIFRADVVTGNNPDRGVHTYSYIYSQLQSATTASGTAAAMGFLGRDYVTLQTPNNVCWSYQYSLVGGRWVKGAQRSNCPIASGAYPAESDKGQISVKGTINGTARTTLDSGIVLNGGRISGTQCAGPNCHNMVLPTFQTWAEYCPGNTLDKAVGSSETLAAGTCYRDITIANKKILTLTDTTNPYYIRSLNFQGAQGNIALSGVPAGKRVTIYVESIGGDKFNGNQYYNSDFAPNMLLINYIGTADLQLNGTADINCQLVAPKINVTLNGNFNFYGGIIAKSIDMIGTATMNYDEGLGVVDTNPVPPTVTVTGLSFQLRKASQRYR